MTKRKLFFLIFLLIYTFLATLFIYNVDDGKTLLFLFLFTLIIVILYMIMNVRMFSATFFFLTFYIMLFFIQPLYNLLIEYHYYQYNDGLIKSYTILTIFGVLLFCIGNILSLKNNIKLDKVYFNKTAVKKATNLLMFILIISIILCFIDAGTINILQMSRLELKNSTSLLRLIATFGFYVSSILFFLIAFTSKARKKSNVLSWMFLFIFIETIIFLLFRTRSVLVAHSSAILVGYYYSNLYACNKKENKISPKFLTIIMAVIVFVSAITTRFFRGFLQPGQSVSNFDFDLKLFLEMSIHSGDIGYSTRVFQILEYVPQYYDFLYGQSYYRLLFIFIPRSIWPDKPENTQQIVAGWLEPHMEGMSVPPGIIGDAYINFGFYGIIIMVCFGIFFSIIDNRVNKNNFMLWAVSSSWIFHLVRGGFTNPIIIFIVLLVTIYFINSKFFNNKSNDNLYENQLSEIREI